MSRGNFVAFQLASLAPGGGRKKELLLGYCVAASFQQWGCGKVESSPRAGFLIGDC